MEELIAKKYAEALRAVSSDIVRDTKVLGVLSEALSDEEIRKVLDAPIVPAATKTEMVLATLGETTDEKLVNLVKVLGEHKRLTLIPAIAKVLEAQLQKASNRFEGEVISAEALEKEEVKKLEKALEAYSGAEIELKQKKEDIDGIKVTVDDLGLEVNFSKERVKQQLIDHIVRAL